jgi:hypothetical protein
MYPSIIFSRMANVGAQVREFGERNLPRPGSTIHFSFRRIPCFANINACVAEIVSVTVRLL